MGIAIEGTAATPSPASIRPSMVVTWRVSQTLGILGATVVSA